MELRKSYIDELEREKNRSLLKLLGLGILISVF